MGGGGDPAVGVDEDAAAVHERHDPAVDAAGALHGDAWYQNDEFIQAIEQSRASGNKRRVIPVLLDDLSHEKLPYGLRRLHAVRETGRDPYGLADKLEPVVR
ncbi:MAG: hypothetical protein H6705_02595 [Myxococcales bacterium]|nr:hypothetical protein [Myxococcales bacterium]